MESGSVSTIRLFGVDINIYDTNQTGNDNASVEEIPGLVEAIRSPGGERPVFLFQKRLEESDVKKQQNRLFVPKKEREKLMEFMSEEEKTAVMTDGKGIDVLAFDVRGKMYKLHVGWWKSVKMVVVKLKWGDLVAANKAEKAHIVEVWGYRVENGELRFRVNFKAG